MNNRLQLNFPLLTPIINILFLFCTGCLTRWSGNNPSTSPVLAHPSKTATPTSNDKKSAKVKRKESLGKSEKEKERRDDNNLDLLSKVTNRLRVGKNISTSLTGKDLRGEICFVKFDTLPTSKLQEKFQITISEMLQGQEIALSFALFASELADKESSVVLHATLANDKIFIEQDESAVYGTTLRKKISIDIQNEDRGQFVIEQLTSEAPLSKSCTVALISKL